MDGDALNKQYPLRPIVNGWMEKIRLAAKFKRAKFQNDADEAMKFFECSKELNDLMWKRDFDTDPDGPTEGQFPAPMFRVCVGKTAEAVQLFGPALYHRNPVVIVEPKNFDPPLDLMMQLADPNTVQMAVQQAQMAGQQFNPESLFPPERSAAVNAMTSLLVQWVLDYMQREMDKKTHSRRAIDEAIIKGRGILWTETYEPYHGGPTLLGSFHDSVDNMVVDPDAECLEDCKWIARRCCHPTWEVADKYDLDEKKVREFYGTHESGESQSDSSDDKDWKRKTGKSNDLIEYWKVYSKMGMGHRLSKVKDLDDVYDVLDSFGDNCYIVVADKVPHPLNLKTSLIEELLTSPDDDDDETKQADEDAFMAVQWPIPFWADGEWPCTAIDFHEVPGSPWPMSHMKPGLGYVKFLNWTMSFLTNRIRHSCRTVASTMKAAGEDLKQRLFSGQDFEVLEIEHTTVPDGDIKKMVHFLEVPSVNKDIWPTIEAVFDLFDKATGLTELAYGASGGMRSATEVKVKEGNRSIRPDDMASKVEDAMSRVARKEAMALRWIYEVETVRPIVGERGASLWEAFVMSGDIDRVSREFTYRVEAGSTRKPNKETRVEQMNQMMQTWSQVLIQYAQMTGNVQVINALLEEWCKAMDIESKKFALPPPPPPPPDPNAAKVQAEIALKEREFELKQQTEAAKLQAQQIKSQLDVQAIQAKTQAQVESAKLKMQIEAQKANQQMQLGQQQMVGDMQMQRMELGMKAQEAQMGHVQKQQEIAMQGQQHQQQLGMQADQHKQKLSLGAQQAKAKMQQQKQASKSKPKPKGR